MSSNKFKYLLIVMISTLLFVPGLNGEGKDKKEGNRLEKTTGQPVRTWLNINNISTVIKDDGISDIDKDEANSGFVYPKGSGKTAVFTSGFLWGARVEGDPQVRVGGTAYRTGLQSGKIISPGVAEDPDLSVNRIYRVRSDVYPGGPVVDLTADAIDEFSSASALRAQYELDWNEWPADRGAPYFDGNGNGKYDPDPTSGDIPGVKGADQTIWFVANDLNEGRTQNLYGALPLGIEMQATLWAYSQTGALGNMYFRKYKIINKSNITFKDMYACMWSDVDLGNSTDDYVGTDTTLSLQYCYNANAVDAVYSPLPPPAVGFDFFQGPLQKGVAGEDKNKNGVDDAVDYAIFDGVKIGPGYINLPMTAAFYFTRGAADVTDPVQGSPEGSTQFYNFFQGKIGLTGKYFVNSVTGQKTTYVLTGDPLTRQGWVDGLDQGPGDRRQGLSSGPFNMAPNDTQEVVVAEMVAGAIPGVDRLSAIGLLKFYDKQAQLAYDNFFDLPVAPPVPEVDVSALDKTIILNWGENIGKVKATETFSSKGYAFQGYNVYQLPSASASISQGKRIATYDINDGVGKINDEYFDPTTGVVAVGVKQFGNDTGIKRFIKITTDDLKGGTPLINGIKYYFAVTAYSFNPDLAAVPNNLENPLAIYTVIPHANNPGVTTPDAVPLVSSSIKHDGTADASIDVDVISPAQLTGHQYQVSFHNQVYTLGEDGNWAVVDQTSKLAKIKDLTGSSLSSTAAWSENKGSIDIHYLLDLVSPDYDWVDGIKLTLPAGITIDAVFKPISHNDGSGINFTIDKTTNSIFFGDSSRSKNGLFAGGEDIIVRVHPATLPIITNYTIFDDNYGGNIVDASGTDTLKGPIANQIITQKQWAVKDLTSGNFVLQNQTILNGIDLYAPNSYFEAHSLYGPGGSSGSLTSSVGAGANVIFDGIQVALKGSYVAPTKISSLELNGEHLGVYTLTSGFDMTDFTVFGYDGTAANTLPLYGGAGGTTSVDALQQDYEIKWTGVLGDTTIDGKNVVITKSGGSFVTLFGASGYSLADHPLNPDPGVDQSFTIRVPFEVWNVDKNEQVNLLVWDRLGKLTDPGFQAWNTLNRMYTWVVNTKYSPTVIDAGSQVVSDNATWNWVFFSSEFHTGDVIKVNYNNPIQIGKDTFTFTVPQLQYSADLAKQDISKINVFPNPYYGVNTEELNKYNRFVTFTHLPAKAKIRIFNLAGVLVKRIDKNSNSQFERWDLANETGLPVASGLYIAYIDMPDLGTTKIVKLAIIQEQQILDRF